MGGRSFIDCLPGWISVAVLCQLSALASAGSFDIFHNAYDYHSTSPSCYGLHQGLEDYVACFLSGRIHWNICCILGCIYFGIISLCQGLFLVEHGALLCGLGWCSWLPPCPPDGPT